MRVFLIAIVVAGCAAQPAGIFSGVREHPAIGYETRPLHDSIARLNRKLGDGEIKLDFDGPSGYLRSVLDALAIPVESQIAVFSKTSLQAQIISPQNPRTIFFNDSTAVAWVHGEPFVEAATQDPEQGMIFYVLSQSPAARPQFLRSDGQCLRCHENYSTLGVPGTLLRSVYPAVTGLPYRSMGDHASDHRTPFAERWGGWYVTGKFEPVQHMGNTVFFDPENPASRRSLAVKIDPSVYLSPYSDVVALMVFEHQMHAMNLLTRFNWEMRWSAYEHKPFDMHAEAKELADYLLFVGEPPLPGKLEGLSGFTEKFAARGPLREFDLKTRLMKNRCSYMIESEAFDALPKAARVAVYRAMREVLAARGDLEEIAAILRKAKPEAWDYLR